MKLSNKIAACALSVIAAASLVSCGFGQQIAAEVNGDQIPEETITKRMEALRQELNLQENDAWGQWLADNGFTPENLRSQQINFLIDDKLVIAAAKERGISVDENEIKNNYNKMKENYSEEEWQNTLSRLGIKEDDSYTQFKASVLESKLIDEFKQEASPSDEELLEVAQSSIFNYDQTKKSSCIQFAAEDEQTAKEVLDKITNGSLSFEDAVSQYSTDEESKNRGGDKGWDINEANMNPVNYNSALQELEKNQISDLVIAENNIYIIKCTDVFTVPEDGLTSFESVPAEFVEEIKMQAHEEVARNKYDAWYSEFRSKVDIKINDMPKDVSYAVDMSQFQAQKTNKTNG